MRNTANEPHLAGQQDQVFTRLQAIEAGYTPYRVRKLVHDGRWIVVLGSVYAAATARLTAVSLAWAAQLAAGAGAVVSHTTAARLWGLVVPVDPEVHVIVPRERRLTIEGLRTHRIDIPESALAHIEGVVCSGLLRTVIDCLLWLPEEAGRALTVAGLQQQRFTIDELRGELMRTGQRHGLSRAWSVLRDVAAGAHSEAEVRVHRILRSAGISGWTANHPVEDADGLVGIVDIWFEAVRLVVEIDGRAHHSDELAFQRDRSRQNRLVALGCRVLRFTWDDLVHRPENVAAAVCAALAESDGTHPITGVPRLNARYLDRASPVPDTASRSRVRGRNV